MKKLFVLILVSSLILVGCGTSVEPDKTIDEPLEEVSTVDNELAAEAERLKEEIEKLKQENEHLKMTPTEPEETIEEVITYSSPAPAKEESASSTVQETPATSGSQSTTRKSGKSNAPVPGSAGIVASPPQEPPTNTPPTTYTAEITPPVEEIPPAVNTVGQTVYITPTGKRYHYANPCGAGSYSPSTMADAQARGLTACQKCT